MGRPEMQRGSDPLDFAIDDDRMSARRHICAAAILVEGR